MDYQYLRAPQGARGSREMMGFLSSPFKAYVRWRHSRGFGVHSPFAYTLVHMAIRPGDYGYYGYADIDRVILAPAFRGYPEARSDARLVLRLLVALGSHRLVVSDGLPAMCAAAKGAGVGCIRFRDGKPPATRPGDFVILTPDYAAEAPRILSSGAVLLAICPPPRCVEQIYSACGRGLIFHGVRLILAVPRKEMAFVAYTMKF